MKLCTPCTGPLVKELIEILCCAARKKEVCLKRFRKRSSFRDKLAIIPSKNIIWSGRMVELEIAKDILEEESERKREDRDGCWMTMFTTVSLQQYLLVSVSSY